LVPLPLRAKELDPEAEIPLTRPGGRKKILRSAQDDRKNGSAQIKARKKARAKRPRFFM
jgi:hypothetical protein